jgi:hypothetical protein
MLSHLHQTEDVSKATGRRDTDREALVREFPPPAVLEPFFSPPAGEAPHDLTTRYGGIEKLKSGIEREENDLARARQLAPHGFAIVM